MKDFKEKEELIHLGLPYYHCGGGGHSFDGSVYRYNYYQRNVCKQIIEKLYVCYETNHIISQYIINYSKGVGYEGIQITQY
jgi:hypothetical protein